MAQALSEPKLLVYNTPDSHTREDRERERRELAETPSKKKKKKKTEDTLSESEACAHTRVLTCVLLLLGVYNSNNLKNSFGVCASVFLLRGERRKIVGASREEFFPAKVLHSGDLL